MTGSPLGAVPAVRRRPTTYSNRQVWLVLSFALLGTLLDGAELNIIGYPLTYISHSLDVTTKSLVEVTTLQGFASIAGGLIFGWAGDVIGRKRTYVICVVSFGVAAILGGLAGTFDALLLTRLLAGIGMGGLFGLGYSMFTECWEVRDRGTVGGVIQSMYFVGEIVTEGVIFACLTIFGHADGWRDGYVILGAASLAVALLAAALLPESEQWRAYQAHLRAGDLSPEQRRSAVPLFDLFRRKMAWGTVVFVVIATCMFLTTNSMIVYLSTFLMKTEHMSLGRSSLIVLFGYVVTASSYVITGKFSDRISRRWAFVSACAFGTIGFAWFLALVASHRDHIPAAYWTSPTFWALMMCAAAASGFGVLGVWLSEFLPTRLRSTGSNFAYYGGRGLGAGVYPLFALDIAGSVPMALALGIAGPVLGGLAALVAPDYSGRQISAVE
ncbi:MAG TPA: MFS transporter [Trebonia sp.]|jgi:MFS family permease|nr:MFS transporter [Trebonia sp.]